jgi:uncharacterized protein YjiK
MATHESGLKPIYHPFVTFTRYPESLRTSVQLWSTFSISKQWRQEHMMQIKFAALSALMIACMTAQAAPIELTQYGLVGRYALPEPTRVTPPSGSLLAQEASAVTWNRDTNSLFVVGDGGTSVVQVSLTGQLINSMTLAAGSSPTGTAYYDPEGLAYVGNNQFVLVEERDRVANLFTYAPGTTLDYSGSQHVKLGTTIGNIGIEGISYDPLTGGFIAVKEQSPMGVFQTNIDFAAGTATNGSASTVNSVNLFDPTLTGLTDLADVFALSNLVNVDAAQQGHILLLSQENGRIIEVDRVGTIYGSLTIPLLPNLGNLSVADQQHEGLTMDDARNLYVVSENGGGDINHPELWVFAPTQTAVPEPGTGLFGAIGIAAFALRWRRTKR